MTTPEDAPPQKAGLPRSEIALRTAIVLATLLVFALIGLMFVVAIRGEVTWQRGELAGDRLFLIMERRQRGLGWEHVGSTGQAPATGGQVCTRTTVRYYLWEGQGENITYCECYRQTATGLSYIDSDACP